jgi:hypothetical protein
MSVVAFPAEAAREHTKRAQLAAYLRELADLIAADELEVEPSAAVVVLTGRHTHEVVCCGYADDEWGYQDASRTADFVARDCGYPTVGRNRRVRGDYVARPLRHSNIVDGAFPRAAARQPSPEASS